MSSLVIFKLSLALSFMLFTLSFCTLMVPSSLLLIMKLCTLGVRNRTCTGMNADLWQCIWAVATFRGVDLSSRWVKSHCDTNPAWISARSIPACDVIGNCCADSLADRGAGIAALPSALVSKVLGSHSLLQKVQLRLVSVLRFVLVHFPRTAALSAPARTTPRHVGPQLSWFVLMSSHSVVLHSCGATCSVCLQGIRSSVSSDLRHWLLSRCPGTPFDPSQIDGHGTSRYLPDGMSVWIACRRIHSSHCLRVFRGLFYCVICGRMAGTRLYRLVSPCPGKSTYSGRRSQSALSHGNLPWGLRTWPSQRTAKGMRLLL